MTNLANDTDRDAARALLALTEEERGLLPAFVVYRAGCLASVWHACGPLHPNVALTVARLKARGLKIAPCDEHYSPDAKTLSRALPRPALRGSRSVAD